MRIGFDVRPFLSRETGVGIYLRNLLFEMAHRDVPHEFYLFSSSWKERFPGDKIPPFSHSTFKDFRCPVKAVNFFWNRLGWPTLDAVFGVKLDLTHSATPLILPTRGRKIVTVCDLFFLDDPENADREARTVFRKKTKASLKKADGVLAISEFTRRSVLDHFDLDPEKILAVPLGLHPVHGEAVPEDVLAGIRARFNLPEEFILFVGAVERRKNLAALIEALRLIHEKEGKIPLVIAGRRGGDSPAVEALVSKRGLDDLVIFTDYLTDIEIRALYRLARVFVYPSRLEGFGLPVLEAMAAGVPCAVSRTGALPETGGDGAVYFDPGNPGEIAGIVLDLLRDEKKRGDLVEKGRRRAALFTWNETARRTLEFYEKVAGRT